MGQMKRAEARERLRRAELASATHFVKLKWRTVDGHLILDVVNNRTDEPLTRQRKVRSQQSIFNLVQRSLTGTRPSPFTELLRRNLELGVGSVEIEITGEQHIKLCADPPTMMPS